jgi:hypothetical protein
MAFTVRIQHMRTERRLIFLIQGKSVRSVKNEESIETKHGNRLNVGPALILALTKIRPRIEVLACQEQAQSSH